MAEENEELENVTVIEAAFGGDETHTMMSYVRDSVHYISFAYQDPDGIWCFGPFPQHVLECEDCMTDLVESMKDQGYTLVEMPEQAIRSC